MLGRLVRHTLAGLAMGLAAAAPRAAQQPVPLQLRPPVFRGTSDLVEIDAVVTDRTGATVHGLTREDFQVTEDGAPQELVQFSFVDIPMPSPESATAPRVTPGLGADVSSNARQADSRQYVIVLDGFHVDSSRSTITRKLARQFIEESMGPRDVAAVMVLGRNSANQQFTSNKALLVAALDQFVGQKSQSATYNITQDIQLRPQTGVAPEDTESGARATEARIMLESMRQLCQSLGATQGIRRSIVLFSEGLDFDTSDLIGQDQRPSAGGSAMHEPAKHASLLLEAEQEMFVAARRANAAIFTVDPRGTTIGEDVGIQIGSDSPGTGLLRETQRGQGTLRTFAEQTGGLAVVGTNNMAAGFAQIARANSAYYVLGYSPTNTARDGAYRKIAVSVRPPHLDVNARKGYYAAAAAKTIAPATPASAPGPNAASPRMRELLASALPVGGLGLRVTGGPIRSQGGKVLVSLVVEIDTKDLPFADKNGVLSNDIEMAFLALDASGRMQAANRSVGNLRLPAAARASVTNGLRYVVEFPAAPGRYQVRVAAHESQGGAGGSALLDVDAIDLAKAPLSIATILLGSEAAEATPTTGSFPVVKSLLTLSPTATREFARGDTLVVFAEVSDGSAGKPHDVEITASARGGDGGEAFHDVVTKSSRDLTPAAGGYGRLLRIPLATFAPGPYVLTIDASAAAGKPATRSIAFVVR